MSSGAARTGGGGKPYFVDPKKGEVNELKQLMGKPDVQRDKKKMRDVVKKVIGYMTLGIDVSRLFSEMVRACYTTDLVVKKMVYLYLTHYAPMNPELAILAINTLRKDCGDADPMVRGLAMRSLSSLRLQSVLEYILDPLRACLKDSSPYVRRAAVIGVLKIHHLDRATVEESDLVDRLYNMVRDADPAVAIDCLNVLNEIMADEGGLAVNQQIMTYLLNRIGDFSEWGQITVLGFLPKYSPASQEEIFAIMNILDGCLRTSNSGVALATTRCFQYLTERLDEGIRRQAYMRVKSPLLTLMASPSKEISFAVLKHIELMVQKQPGIFDDAFKQFYCHLNDPSSVKYVKLEILPLLANDGNTTEILAELSEYVTDVSAELAKRAVRAIGKIAIRLPSAADAVMNQLMEYLELDVENVRSDGLVMIRQLLMKFPERAGDIIPILPGCFARTTEPEGKAAGVWIFGEFGQIFEKAPYILEPLIDNVVAEAPEVRMQVLVATAKLFFKRAPEVRDMFGRLLKALIESDDMEPDLHDRALLYYRLLEANVREAERVICTQKEIVGDFAEDMDSEIKQQIFQEFNTLSVIYGQPSAYFIAEENQIVDRFEGEEEALAPVSAPAPEAGAPASGGMEDGEEDLLGFGVGSSSTTTTTTNNQDQGSLLAGGNVPMASSSAAAPTNAAGAAGGDTGDLLGDLLGFGSAKAWWEENLQDNVQLSQEHFQQQWMDPSVTASAVSFSVNLGAQPDLPTLEGLLRGRRIVTLASGVVQGTIKAYAYARDATNLYLAELIVANGNLSGTAKSAPGPADKSGFVDAIKGTLQ